MNILYNLQCIQRKWVIIDILFLEQQWVIKNSSNKTYVYVKMQLIALLVKKK